MSTPSRGSAVIHERPAELLQQLIRFDTTNPPGNEKACVGYIEEVLRDAGFETILLAKDPNRPNLITRLRGRGSAPPLLFYGHVDVVTTASQEWTHPPFEGNIADGYIWGRGSLDCKGGLAMMMGALLRAKAEGLEPAGDVVFSVMCDEEDGSEYGAKYLVAHHPDHFAGIRYAISEFGGVSTHIGGERFYPIQIAEKQKCWVRAIVRGPSGHGARPMRGGSMARLARVLRRLERNKLPVHVTPVVKQMIEIISSSLPFYKGMVLRQVLNPRLTDRILGILGETGENFEPLLHNTVNATVVRGGDKINVIPGEITVELDGRLLPGYGPDDLLGELRHIIGQLAELEVVLYDPGPPEPDMTFFTVLADLLRDFDTEGVPMPLLLPAVTDARFLSQIGIQTFGFTPMQLPKDFNFFATIHAADERIPVGAVEFGAKVLYTLLQRYEA